MFGGQVARNVTFFVETDTSNLGKAPPTGKNIPSSTIIQDAYGEFKVSEAFAIDAGLMSVPFSRNSVQSAATLLPIDSGTYTFSQSTPTQSSTGRDAGFQAKGSMKLTPVLQFSNRDVVDTRIGDENHWSIGLNYWWAGHNADIKAAYSRINPTGSPSRNEFTAQLQLYYF
jgi:hypothetical protein